MLDQIYIVPRNASEVLGDVSGLAEQLGSAEQLCPWTASAASRASRQVATVGDLRHFLTEYSTAILLAHELPSVLLAYEHARKFRVRELIALDQELAQNLALSDFAKASWSVGKMQLRRLRPLRDDRVVQRYFAAVEAGEAKGWHTLVFGLVLAVYSLPLRQGLVHFAHRTLSGFIEAAAQRFTIANADRDALLLSAAGVVPGAVEQLIATQGAPAIQLS